MTTSTADERRFRSHDLQRLAALAKLAEQLSNGDVRVLLRELREGFEALAGRGAEVIAFDSRRR